MSTVDRILELCRTLRCKTSSERELQNALEKLLRKSFPSVGREVKLSPRDIPDFLVEDVVLEIKVSGSAMAVTRQIHRYAEHEAVSAVILITTRAKHKSIPAELNGKPVHVAWLIPF